MIEIPYELRLALKTIVDSETAGDYENQELIFILYQHGNLTWEEIKEKATITSFDKGTIRECTAGLWVVGFIEKDGDEFKQTYELTPFGRRLLDSMLSAMFVVREEKTMNNCNKCERYAISKLNNSVLCEYYYGDFCHAPDRGTMRLEEPTREELIEVNHQLWNTIGQLIKLIEIAHPRLIRDANQSLGETAK